MTEQSVHKKMKEMLRLTSVKARSGHVRNSGYFSANYWYLLESRWGTVE